jgi:hypothetical protein
MFFSHLLYTRSVAKGLKFNAPKKLVFLTQNLVKVYKVVFTQFRFLFVPKYCGYDKIFSLLTLSTNGAVQPQF